jgi:hypothetical protein
MISKEIYEGATTERLKLCPNCQSYFDDEAIEAVLDENDRKLLQINDENAEIWSTDLGELESYFHCQACNRYWIDDIGTSLCPGCYTLTCSQCWKEVGDGCECNQDKSLSEAEVRSSAVIRKCPRCRTPFVKDENGCNHVTCSVCQAELCYFCGEHVKDDIYSTHFGDQSEGMCPMYTSSIELHDARADAAAARFHQNP